MLFTEWFASKGRHSHDVTYQQVWDAAQAEIKERCAKVCDAHALRSSNPMNFAENCAADIRALD